MVVLGGEGLFLMSELPLKGLGFRVWSVGLRVEAESWGLRV